MSIFAKIRSGKKAADEHKAAEAAKASQEAAAASKPKAPYHHVPRHAAQDALAGTPGVADRTAIQEANRQRTMYAQNSFYSTSSPSLIRSQSSDVLRSLPAGSAGTSAAPSVIASRSMSRCSSQAGGARGPRVDRRTHPGYQSYQSFQLPTPHHSRRGSGQKSGAPKSPLSSEPITPPDSGAASSSSSFSSTRSYTDPIEPSAPLSQRLEGVTSTQAARRVPLYTSKSATNAKPWEVRAANAAKKAETAEVQVTEVKVQTPQPTAQPAKRSRFMGFKGKQQAVAAC